MNLGATTADLPLLCLSPVGWLAPVSLPPPSSPPPLLLLLLLLHALVFQATRRTSSAARAAAEGKRPQHTRASCCCWLAIDSTAPNGARSLSAVRPGTQQASPQSRSPSPCHSRSAALWWCVRVRGCRMWVWVGGVRANQPVLFGVLFGIRIQLLG